MAVKSKKGDPNSKIQQQVVTVISRPVQVDSADISVWKNAVSSARYGRRIQLNRLTENLILDGVLSRSINKRIEAITNAELIFVDKNNEPVPEINTLIDTPAFELLLREINLANAHGISVIDVLSILPLEVFSVPRRNINAELKLIIPDESSIETGLAYQDIPFIIEVTSDDPFGYIYKAAPYVIYKRGGFGDWAQFVELFGMPFRLGQYDAFDTNTRDEIVKSLQMAGAAPWAVVPKEGKFEFIQNRAQGDGQLYDLFIDRCDKEILISVLGQTMTTQDGSSKSQSETHKEVEEDINKSDSRFTRRILNDKLVPILAMAGLPVEGGKFIFKEQGENLSTLEKINIAVIVKTNGIPVSDDYFYETSGIPKPTPTQIKQLEPPTPDPVPVPDNPDLNNPDPNNPDPNNPEPDKAPDAPAPGKKPFKPIKPIQKKLSDSISRVFDFFVKALDRGAPLKF